MKQCNTLEEVRSEIDTLDDKIVALIADRNAFIHQAAGFKNTVDEVKAPERVNEIIQRVRHQAGLAGLSPNLINEIYEIMIKEMVESEIAEFRNKSVF